MYAEQMELYNYITNTIPYQERYSKIKNSSIIKLRSFVRDAIGDYIKDFGGNNDTFSQDDFDTVVKWLQVNEDDIGNFRRLEKFLKECYSISEVYPINKLPYIRKSHNSIENMGVTYAVYKFIKFIGLEYTIDEIDNNLSSERDMGRFDLFQDIDIHDDFAISYFQLTDGGVSAIVIDKTIGKFIAYIDIFWPRKGNEKEEYLWKNSRYILA